jgi:hypothetical protein
MPCDERAERQRRRERFRQMARAAADKLDFDGTNTPPFNLAPREQTEVVHGQEHTEAAPEPRTLAIPIADKRGNVIGVERRALPPSETAEEFLDRLFKMVEDN